jgi:hypothetical protein
MIPSGPGDDAEVGGFGHQEEAPEAPETTSASPSLLPFGPPPFESTWPPAFLSFCNPAEDLDRTMAPFGLYGGGGPYM